MSIVKASSPLISTAKLACAGTATMPVASGFQRSNKGWGFQQIRSSVWRFDTISRNPQLPMASLINIENANGNCWPTDLTGERWKSQGCSTTYVLILLNWKIEGVQSLLHANRKPSTIFENQLLMESSKYGRISSPFYTSDTMSPHQNVASIHMAKGRDGFQRRKIYFWPYCISKILTPL